MIILNIEHKTHFYQIFLFDFSMQDRDQITSVGHRAPLADLFRANRSVNSVNTRTPAILTSSILKFPSMVSNKNIKQYYVNLK